MTERTAKLACLLLTAMVLVGMGLSTQAYGLTPAVDCCCQAEAVTESDEASCCPGGSTSKQHPKEQDSEDCPCSCPTCGVMVRTANFYSIDTLTMPLFSSVPQFVDLLPDSRPASAVLGVDIQPPIA